MFTADKPLFKRKYVIKIGGQIYHGDHLLFLIGSQWRKT